MIIIPQLFNYRLIIGSLVIAIIVLGSYSFVSYNTFKEETEFLQNEQKLMETELSQMLRLYHDLENKNNNLNAQLEESRLSVQEKLDSLRLLQANEAVISKYRSQILRLKEERFLLEQRIQDLDVESQATQLENKDQKAVGNKVTFVETKLPDLEVNTFAAKALRLLKSGENIETSKARKVNHLEVCFALSNIFKPEELFIQVLNPRNNVLSDKREANFGNTSLIYSKKLSVDQWNINKDICTQIESGDDQFIQGTYLINIFNRHKLLANTTIELD